MSAVVSYGLGDERLNEDVAAGLANVEQRLAQAVKSDDDFIASAARHLVDAGGKRFRPLLAVLAARGSNASLRETLKDAEEETK